MEILNKTIEQVRKQYGVAGGILIAIKDGKVLLKECFGQADAEKGKPVDSKTLFQIASCSKAFTTMVAGQLCDEGKMTWDTPVKQLMPDFKMVDKYAEEHVTPRDMACHRTGMTSCAPLSARTEQTWFAASLTSHRHTASERSTATRTRCM